MPNPVVVSEYTYQLPDDRIARFPLPGRSASKLLYFHEGIIEHEVFSRIPSLLPPNTSLYFNDTRVIPARLVLQKSTGAVIEIFLLQPIKPSTDMALAMKAPSPVVWKCLIGNAKRWKEGPLAGEVTAEGRRIAVEVTRVMPDEVMILWDDAGVPFASLLEALGQTPLPPYLQREPVAADKATYQTVYCEKSGAVAAPTAGLHFTDALMEGPLQPWH